MPLLSLPVELLTLIAGESKCLDAIKNLRLTCNKLSKIARAATFETINLYPDKESYERFENLQNHPELNLLVHTVVLYTALGEELENQHAVDREEHWRGAEIEAEWSTVASSIGKFSNLKSIHVKFHTRVTDDLNMPWFPMTQLPSFRTKVLETVFAALNNPEHPTPNLCSLTIKDLQNINSSLITQSPNFKNVLSRLTELHLYITTEKDETTPNQSIGYDALHQFFRELPDIWLKPTQKRLTHLTLYVATYWGWAPKFDPRRLYFPKLKYLALGNHTFTHDWQIDWILSHGSSLETLILDDCPILFFICPLWSLDENTSTVCHDDHTIYLPGETEDGCDENTWVFDRRWYNYFPKFEDGLPLLIKFVCGHGIWHTGFFNKSAFEQRDVMLPRLERMRYITYKGDTYSCQYEEPDGKNEYARHVIDDPYDYHEIIVKSPAVLEPPYRSIASCGHGPIESATDTAPSASDAEGCQQQDWEALTKLLNTVNRRAHAKGIA